MSSPSTIVCLHLLSDIRIRFAEANIHSGRPVLGMPFGVLPHCCDTVFEKVGLACVERRNGPNHERCKSVACSFLTPPFNEEGVVRLVNVASLSHFVRTPSIVRLTVSKYTITASTALEGVGCEQKKVYSCIYFDFFPGGQGLGRVIADGASSKISPRKQWPRQAPKRNASYK